LWAIGKTLAPGECAVASNGAAENQQEMLRFIE